MDRRGRPQPWPGRAGPPGRGTEPTGPATDGVPDRGPGRRGTQSHGLATRGRATNGPATHGRSTGGKTEAGTEMPGPVTAGRAIPGPVTAGQVIHGNSRGTRGDSMSVAVRTARVNRTVRIVSRPFASLSGAGRVWLLTASLATITIALFLQQVGTLPEFNSIIRLPWWALAVVFFLTEDYFVPIEFRR